MKAVCRTVLFVVLPLILAMTAASATAQQWETARNNVGDSQFVALPYEVVFVAAKINEVADPDGEGIYGDYQIGTDVLSANEPTGGHELWIVTRNGAVKKLFPLQVHETMTVTHPDTGLQVSLIDTPQGFLHKGSVVEPNLSEDGTRVYFGYFHDTTNNIDPGQGGMSKKGSDLYVLDLSPMLANLKVDPSTLPVQRLTFKIYDGSSQADNSSQVDNDKNKDAMNRVLAASTGLNGWGTVHMHAVEMRTRDGLKLVYASNQRRLMNSNKRMGHENHNFNLHLADLNADGSLGATRQFQYYTTTSAMSPTPLRNGIAFSYQATTADGRNWHIQLSDSEGRWGPLIGYGSNPNLFHLGAFCVDTRGDSRSPAGDYFTAVNYYNLNNEGFGELWKINLADVGLNTYDDETSWGVQPRWQGARKMSLRVVTDGDEPSDTHNGQYIGKITTPRCGLPDDLLMSYTPTSANGRLQDNEGNLNIYRAYIAYRSGFDVFDPTETFNPVTNEGLRILIDDSADMYNLVWPLPVLSWRQRTGDAQQQVSASIIDPQSTVKPGEPFAQVGTSSIYNTDRRPYDCWLGPNGGGQPYNPNDLNNNQKDQIWDNFDALTYVQNQSDFCEALLPENVLGIAVNITSNRTNHTDSSFGYETDLTGPKEAVKLLGLYDVRSQGDQSFQATIPAHTPFDFHLIDRQYGLRLLDVRSWHSLKPRETRTSCGGCHNHLEGQDVPFANTVADLQPPLDMVTQTQQVSYDADCQPIVTTTAQPTVDSWEWQADIWPGFNQYCSACHHSNQAPMGEPGLNALAYDSESDAYNQLEAHYYANSQSGALGSPAFWAARGQRTDGRDNNLATYQPTGGKSPYRFSAIHATDPGLCGQGDAQKARWVHRFGQWIDNHMPRNTGNPYPYPFDKYHPTVDVADVDESCLATTLQIGYWDDTGFVRQVKVFVDDVVIDTTVRTTNGKHLVGNLNLTDDNVIKVSAVDPTGNRQIYEKAVRQLKEECVPGV